MNKKTIILLGAITILVAAPIFFYQSQYWQDLKEGKEIEKRILESGPKEWSLEGDYSIQDVDGGKMVKNESVGLSFFVNEGWSMDGSLSPADEYSIILLSPDAELTDFFLINGCKINIEAMRDMVDFLNLNAEIVVVDEDSEKYKNQKISKEVIIISGHKGLKTSSAPKDPNNSDRIINETIRVKVLVGDDEVFFFTMRFIPNCRENCMQEFDKFLEGVVIE